MQFFTETRIRNDENRINLQREKIRGKIDNLDNVGFLSNNFTKFKFERNLMEWLTISTILFFFCEEVGVVKRVRLFSGEVRRVATALKVVEEVKKEVQRAKDEWNDEEVEGNGGLKVEGEPHTSCVDEMTRAHESWAMRCGVECMNVLTQTE